VLAPGDSTFDQPCPLEHTYMFGYGVQRQAMAARKIGDARLPCPRELRAKKASSNADSVCSPIRVNILKQKQ
jgi:hypothetical protein